MFLHHTEIVPICKVFHLLIIVVNTAISDTYRITEIAILRLVLTFVQLDVKPIWKIPGILIKHYLCRNSWKQKQVDEKNVIGHWENDENVIYYNFVPLLAYDDKRN